MIMSDFSDIEIVHDVKLEVSRWGGKMITIEIKAPIKGGNKHEVANEMETARKSVEVLTGKIPKTKYLPRNKVIRRYC